jgi:CDP-4-dehydro-6-deoxyglucose reductase
MVTFDEPYRLVDFEQSTPAIAQLCLRPAAAALDYRPGQYVLLEDRYHDLPPRSYSIANAPRADGSISMLVTRVPGGRTSNWIHDRLRIGDEVRLSGPYGTFFDEPGSSAPALFLAAGSGLAPVRSLIEAALQRRDDRSLTLIVSARTEADVLDRERVARWQRLHPNFRFLRTLTGGTAATPPRGRIPALLPTLYDELTGNDVFIAGAAGFVADCAAAAEALGVLPTRIHTEAFSAEAVAA